MGIQYNPRIVTDGLVLALDAANTKSYRGSGTTWTDLSGRGNNGILVNTPTYSSANGGSIVFDSTDDYVSVPNSSSFNFGSGDLTVEAIVYLTAYPSNWNGYYTGMIAQQDHNVERSWYFFLGGTSTSWTSLNFGNFTTTVTSTQNFTLNTWYHLVASKIGSSTRLYVNKIDAGVSANIGAIPTTSQNITIGHQDPVWSSYGYSYSLPACLPVIRIYKGKGLTSAEVSQNFNALRGRYGI